MKGSVGWLGTRIKACKRGKYSVFRGDIVCFVGYAELAGVSGTTASRELNALARAGVLRARGTTRNRHFVLATRRPTAGGRPKTWSEERIQRELAALADQLGRWPAYADFERARQLPLYAAMKRTGGHDRWGPEVGYASK